MSDSFSGIRQKTSCSGHSPSFLATIVIWFLQTFGTHLNSWRTPRTAFSPLSPASRPGFSAAWIWRLEDIDRSSNRIYGKGKCRLHTFRTVRHDRAAERNPTPVSASSLLVFVCCIHRVWQQSLPSNVSLAANGQPVLCLPSA